MQGRASKESKSMADQSVYAGVDISKETLDVAICNIAEVKQFANDQDGIDLLPGN
jgi:hypothetical protein